MPAIHCPAGRAPALSPRGPSRRWRGLICLLNVPSAPGTLTKQMWSRRLRVAPGRGDTLSGWLYHLLACAEPRCRHRGVLAVPPRRERQLRPCCAEGSRALREREQPGEAAAVDREGWAEAQQGGCRETLADG